MYYIVLILPTFLTLQCFVQILYSFNRFSKIKGVKLCVYIHLTVNFNLRFLIAFNHVAGESVNIPVNEQIVHNLGSDSQLHCHRYLFLPLGFENSHR